MKTILPVLVGVSLALFAAGASAQAPAQKEIKLSIERQTLRDALNEWAQQTGFQLASEVSEKWVSPSVKGTLTPQAALDRLLAGTPLSYEWLNDRIVAVRDRTRTVSPAGWQSGGGETRQPRLQLAQLDESSNGDAQTRTNAAVTDSLRSTRRNQDLTGEGTSVAELEEIIVTGTHIRGEGAIGSQVTVLGRQDIDRSGFATVQDVLKIVPQNFGATLADFKPGEGNFNRGTGADLRGLGSGATLTLVNGRRQPVSGNGDFVDVDSIPTVAIERIEILSDGASAIYGSDAVGGVINVILRDSYQGAETRVRFATASGDSNESAFSQVLGGTLGDWNSIVGVQYYERTPLPRSDRDFASSADKTSSGGADFRGTQSNPGNILDPNTFLPAFAIPSGQNGTGLTAGELLPGIVNRSEPGAGTDLLSENKTRAGFFSVSRQVTDKFQIFADGRIGERDFVAKSNAQTTTLFVPPTNPFYVDAFGTNEPLLIDYSFLEDFGPEVTQGTTRTWTTTVGSRLDLTRDWRLTGYASYGAEKQSSEGRTLDYLALDTAINDPDPATAFNAFADGSNTNPATLASLRATQRTGAESGIWNVNALAEGALLQLPSGNMRLAIGGDYRKESLDTFSSLLDSNSSFSGQRHVSALFGEITVPLANRRAGGGDDSLLEASLAGRYERYSDFGSTFNPKIGMRFSPLSGLALRGTWATSFKAPRLLDMNQVPRSLIFDLFDPQSPTQFSTVLVRASGADLKEETAKSWTIGIDWEPESIVPGLSASVTYYNIDYKDRIITPGPLDFGQILLEEQQWAEVINRNPSQAELATLCQEAAESGYDCSSTPPTVIFDGRLRNIAALRTRGFDVSLQQQRETRIGLLNFSLAANYVLAYEQQLTSTSQSLDLLDTAANPIDLKLRATAGWSRESLNIDLAANYADDYVSSTAPDSRRVSSYTTIDLGATYRISEGGGLLNGMDFSARVVNLFDADPPFLNSPLGFDFANASPLGRLMSVQVTKAW